MSDRRPEPKLIVPCESCQEYDDIPCGHIATPSELVDELRRGVESGTIKGEVVEGRIAVYVNGSLDWLGADSGTSLVIPVSDGGSET